jgi:leader peptidase (prepilin peptidase) / N-methyltransferase
MPTLLPLYGVLGLLLGSFLTMLISRLPDEERTLFRPLFSACPRCDTRIRVRDNIPVFGWLLLRGRCRSCNERISPMYPLVEMTTFLVVIGVAVRHGESVESLVWILFLVCLLGAAVTDARTLLLPDLFTLYAGLAGLALQFVRGGFPLASERLWHALLAGGLLWVVGFLASRALKREALGFGDVLLLGMMAVFLSFGGALLAMYVGALSGIVIHYAGRGDASRLIPFGTHLAIGGFVVYGLMALDLGPGILQYADMLDSLVRLTLWQG